VKLARAEAEFHVPDGATEDAALARTTHMGIGAHQDDLEIMAWRGILECYDSDTDWFTGVTVTDGGGSARTGPYAGTTDEEMKLIRRAEQRKAANLGDFSAMVQLCHPSAVVKDPKRPELASDLTALLDRARPRVVYTHNLCDKHDTHIGVVLNVIRAIRALPQASRPAQLIGCEVWRNLDWMLDEDKVVMDVSAHESLGAALVGLFDSQIAGGKRYDLATLGRWRANATYFSSHATDRATALIYGMDLTPLIHDDALAPADLARRYLDRFTGDVAARIRKFS
jgi:LmbE family N-acetylglucosaminyl deacetylase